MRTVATMTWMTAMACLLATSPTRAGVILHQFGDGPGDGTGPYASLTSAGAMLYGTTLNGASNDAGTVFSVNTNGTGYSILHAFTGQPGDGDAPIAPVTLAGPRLYGTTDYGGVNNNGVVFAINTNGTGYTILYHFTGGAGQAARSAGAVTAAGSKLYGTTVHGGDYGYGTVFSLNTNGTSFTILHHFARDLSDGGYPREALTLIGSKLYGITLSGGSADYGTAYAIETNGTGFAILHHFTSDGGILPLAGLFPVGATLYGTTSSGGNNNEGTAYAMNTNGTGYTVLHHFKAGNPNDGSSPRGTLTLTGGKLCGATAAGGTNNAGTLFAMNTNGSQYVVFHHFSGTPIDGSSPLAGLIPVASNLYGTTYSGGSSNYGTAFCVPRPGPMPIISLSGNLAFGLVPAGGTSQRMLTITNSGEGALNVSGVVYPTGFSGSWSGAIPAGGSTNVTVTFAPTDGGSYGGTVTVNSSAINGINTISASGSGALPPVITSTSPLPGGAAGVPYSQTLTATGGSPPYAWAMVSGSLPPGLVLAPGSGAITGTPAMVTSVVFQVRATDSLSLSATQTFSLVIAVALPPQIITTSPLPPGIVSIPYNCSLIATGGTPPFTWTVISNSLPPGLDLAPGTNRITGTPATTATNDFLIQVADTMGLSATGSFRLVISASGSYALIHSFTGYPVDGENPSGSLTLVGPRLYGMTYGGGNNYYGTIFSLNQDGSDYSFLHHFAGTYVDGGYPYGSLTLMGSTLYGTTSYGGSNGAYGVAFTINPDASGYEFLHAFGDGNDGKNPYAAPTLVDTMLYGAAAFGGTQGCGAIYAMTTNGAGYTLLHEFGSGSDGVYPMARLTHSDGMLYGTTASGGSYDGGIAYRISTNGSGYTLLHEFGNGNDGRNLYAPLTRVGSKLYGATMFGGSHGNGTLFSMNTDGSHYTTLHSFAGKPNDGSWAFGELTPIGGVLYGTTLLGGQSDKGTVFAIYPDGSGFVVLHSFAGAPDDGENPYYGALTPVGGMLYGLTRMGGVSNFGAIFTMPYALPPAPVIGVSGNLAFGTLVAGTTAQRTLSIANSGTAPLNVSGITYPDGFSGPWSGSIPTGTTVSVTVTFAPTNSGSYDGMITVNSGANIGTNTISVTGSAVDPLVFTCNTPLPGGTVGAPYSLTLSATGGVPPYTWTLASGTLPSGLGFATDSATITGTPTAIAAACFEVRVMDDMGSPLKQKYYLSICDSSLLHSFADSPNDGKGPVATLTSDGARLYGTTLQGGSAGNNGTVFAVNTNGSDYAILRKFAGAGSDGGCPFAAVLLSGTNLYGTTMWGGSNGWGTVFRMGTNGTGHTLLKQFSSSGSDGRMPQAPLIQAGSMLYGVAQQGGSNGWGTVFAISPDGLTYTPLHHFSLSMGQGPQGGLILVGSNLYGTTYGGGSYGRGTIFTLCTNGSGYSVLHHFAAGENDGDAPFCALTPVGDRFYGTTQHGGLNDYGTIFGINRDGSDFAILHRFSGAPLDGAYLNGGLILAGSTLYGVTYMGGRCSSGTVFSIKPDGSGYSIVHSFTGRPDDGAFPYGGPTLVGSSLYGMTRDGGATNAGVVYRLDLESLDSVGDGVPDGWRALNFGSGNTTNDASCASADPDGDGMSNLQEYLAGTCPTNSGSVLEFTALSNSPPAQADARVVIWSSVAGKYYRLERSTNLMSIPVFDYTVRSGIPATPPVNTEPDTNATGQGPYFYRIGLE